MLVCVPAPAGQAAAGARRQAGAARISLSIPGQELGPAPASPHLTLLVTGVETWSCSVSLSILSAVRTPAETRMLGTGDAASGHFSLDLALDIDI